MAVSMLRMSRSSIGDHDEKNGARFSSRTADGSSPAFYQMSPV